MTIGFYLKVKIGKFFANFLSDFYRNREKRHQVREKLNPLNPDRCVQYLKKYFVDVLPIDCAPYSKEVDFIWVCWFQGLDTAPPIVQNCITSLYKFKKDTQEIVLITAENFQEYASVPQKIVRKWKSGIIDNTHFSDILRLHLVAAHGGLWVDATCMMLAPVPQQILSSDFFLFHSHGEFAYTLIQSCFIRCCKNHYIARKWTAAVDKYWIQENRAINYFIPHLLFIALLQADTRFAEEFAKIPIVDDRAMHFLFEGMMAGELFTDNTINTARQHSFIQKLTYKIPASILNGDGTIAQTLSDRSLQL